jgi:hypothetical protein
LLGPALRVPPDRIAIEAHGEREARRTGVPEGAEVQEWRRVDVTINGRIVLTL